MPKPLVSILITSFNQSGYLREAITSALAQTYSNLEIIVGDDHSSDDTPSLLRSIASSPPRIRHVIHEKNLGRVGNYRALLEAAQGQYVVILDGDDYYIDNEFIRDAVALAQEHDLGIVFADYQSLFSDNGDIIDDKANHGVPSISEGRELFVSYPRSGFVMCHIATLYRREPARALDFYRVPITSSDWESLFRLMLRVRVGHLARPVAIWRHHGANESSRHSAERWIENSRWIESVAIDAAQVLGPRAAESWKAAALSRHWEGGVGVFAVLNDDLARQKVDQWAKDSKLEMRLSHRLGFLIFRLCCRSRVLLPLLARLLRRSSMIADLSRQRAKRHGGTA